MLPTQTFQPVDLSVVAFLVVLEALLSADNALILAIMVRHLPKADQKRALFYGLAGAFAFRLVAILMAKQVLLLWWLQAIGAAYLLYMPLAHFRTKDHDKEAKPLGKKLWPTVLAVELADIAFAIDSVLAGVALIRSPDKIWVVFAGAVIGIILLRFAANAFIKLLAKYPALDDMAYLLVGWVGVKLAFTAVHNYGEALAGAMKSFPEMPDAVFWGVMGLLLIGGTLAATRKGHKEKRPVLLPEDGNGQ
jgi:YkoY family integral membrane protein